MAAADPQPNNLENTPRLGGQSLRPDDSPRLGGDAALTHLVEGLRHEDAAVRERAADALGERGGAGARHLLLEALSDESASVRWRAARALGQLGDAPEPVLAALRSRLQEDPAPGVRQAAADALGRLADSSAVLALIAALDDGNPSVYERAAEALGIIGAALQDGAIHPDATSERIAAALIRRLGRAYYLLYDLGVRRTLTRALARIGAPAVPLLIERLRGESPREGEAAAEALGQIVLTLGDPTLRTTAIRALIDATHHREMFVARAAIRALGNAAPIRGRAALRTRALDALLDLLHTSRVIAPVVISIRPRPRFTRDPASPVIMPTHEYLRPYLVEALGRIGAAHGDSAGRVMPALIEALYDDEYDLRRAAVVALGEVGGAHPEAGNTAVPALARCLTDEAGPMFSRGERIRDVAADALRLIGTPDALKALDAYRGGRTPA